MSEPSDIAGALYRLADRITVLDSMERLPLNIKDANGTNVGECHLGVETASARGCPVCRGADKREGSGFCNVCGDSWHL